MSESNDPETERQESNALSKVIEIVQKYPIITYLGTIVAAFGMGFASYGAIIGVNSNKIISQEKFDHLSQTEKCLNKLIENQLKYSFNIEECKKYPFLGEMKIVLTANELQLNRDKNDGKIGISGNISSQDFIGNDGLIKKKTKVWIISSYFDLNQQRKCYREGFLAGKDYDINLKNSKNSKLSSPAVKKNDFQVYLLGIDDDKINQKLGDIQSSSEEEDCSFLLQSNYLIKELSSQNVAPLESFNLATNSGSSYRDVEVQRSGQDIVLTVTGSGGYVIDGEPTLSSLNNKRLFLDINGIGDGAEEKLFKLEVNNQPLEPNNQDRIFNSLNNDIYIKGGNGTVGFDLPETVTKINFVFYQTNLNNLQISANFTEKS